MKLSLLLILVGLGIFGCDSAVETTPTQSVGDPYRVGNYWIYERIDYDNGVTGPATEDSIAVKARDVVDLIDKITLSNDVVYCKGDSGIYDQDFNVFLFKYPVTVRQDLFTSGLINVKLKWGVHLATIVSSVNAIQVTVTVPAGKFIANEYRYKVITDSGKVAYQVNHYFAPTIGIIRTDTYEAPDINADLQLISATKLKRFHIQ